jgi:hypothetical protein
MIRTLYTLPTTIDWVVLANEIGSVVPDLRGVNQSEGQVAVYTDTEPDETLVAAVAAVVAAHTPPPYPPLDPVGRMATLAVITFGDETAQDWARAAGYEVGHLVHEAQAWALGNPS